MKKMYDKKGNLRPEYEIIDSEMKKATYYDIKEKIDYKTNVGKGNVFYSVDGEEWDTYELAIDYNDKLLELWLSCASKDIDMFAPYKYRGYKSVDGKVWKKYELAVSYNVEFFKQYLSKNDNSDNFHDGMHR